MKSSKFMSVGEYIAAIIESVKKGCADAGVNPPESVEFKVGVYDDGFVGGAHPVSFLVFLSNVKEHLTADHSGPKNKQDASGG